MSWRDTSLTQTLPTNQTLRHTLMTVVEPIFNSKKNANWGSSTTSPAAPEIGTALVGRPSRRLTDEQKKKAKCHICGQIGHIRPDCPTKPSKSPGKSDQARVAAAEKKMNGSKSKTSKLQPSSDSEGDDSDYDAIGFSAVHSSSSFRGNNMLLNLFCFFLSLLSSFLSSSSCSSSRMVTCL